MLAFGTGLAVGARSKNQDAAWDVVKYMFSTDGQRPIVTNQEDVPSAKGLLSEWEKGLPSGVTYDELAKAADQVFPDQTPPQIAEIEKQVQQDLYPFFTGSQTVDQATSTAASHIKGILAGS